MDNETLYFIWRSYKNVLDMLEYRKFTIPSDQRVTFESFIEWASTVKGDEGTDEGNIRKELHHVYEKGSSKIKIATFWYPTPDIGISNVQDIKQQMEELDVQRAILVYHGKLTSYAQSAIRNLRIKTIIIECFTEKELQINLTLHTYVPKHIICSSETKKKVLEQYAIVKDQLPKIQSTDPVCRYIGGMKGQLIKILRESEVMPDFQENGKMQKLYDITYRLVV